MTSERRRAPIFGPLALLAALGAWFLFYCICWKPRFLPAAPTGRVDPTVRYFFAEQMSMYFFQFLGFVFGSVALARRERWWFLPVLALFLVLAIVGLILAAMVLIAREMHR